MVKIENSKRTIMNLAEALLQDRGFNGFSYAHIADQLGVKNDAIHYHFPSKEELGIAVIRRYRDRFKLWTNNARVKDLSHQEKLDWFFHIYSDFRADNGKVCLVGSLEAEFNSIPEGLQKEVESLNREMLQWLEETLNAGREAGVFQFNGAAASKAALIYSSVQGALQMARALGTKKFRDVVEQNKQDILV
jgi:TetR/AcrR family transcriptional regulator, transcriptional repressor for nem operon